MSFSEDLKKAAIEIKADSAKHRKYIDLSLFNSIIRDTPVGNPDLWLFKQPDGQYVDYIYARGNPDYIGGRARGNWQCSVGAPIMTETGRIDNTPQGQNGGESQIEAEMTVLNADINQTLYLTNNLPYIERLELGWSSQAPAGMVRKNLARLEQISREYSGKK